MDIKDIPNEKLHVIVKAAVEAALEQEYGYVSIQIVGSIAEVTISRTPIEISVTP